MFSKKNELGFPLGQELWFVPSTTDSKIVQTKSRALNASKMRDRQKTFLDKMVIIPAYHIASLDEAVQSKRISGEVKVIRLRQAVMAMKSNEFPELNLFQSVDQNAFEGRIFFICHSKLESEAQAVVPILALIMETKFGPRAWRWFFHLAKDAIIGYSWTEETGVTSEEDLILEDTWKKGTIGLFDEDISEDDASSTPKGKGRGGEKKVGRVVKVGFDMVPRGPSNTGNTDDDLASRQSFTSALASRSQKKRKNGGASSATSSLTGNNTVDMDAITSRFAEDPGFRKMLHALVKVDSPNISTGGGK